MKFRKKPIIIEAMQFTNENKESVYFWASEKQMNIKTSIEGKYNMPCLIVPTLEGDMICSLGDYLIVEPFPIGWRKIYPCKEFIFDKTYEAIV